MTDKIADLKAAEKYRNFENGMLVHFFYRLAVAAAVLIVLSLIAGACVGVMIGMSVGG